jgi:hypothetical protein
VKINGRAPSIVDFMPFAEEPKAAGNERGAWDSFVGSVMGNLKATEPQSRE